MATTISTDAGEYVIYHVSESGDPAMHITDNGNWFFQPADVNDGEVFSGAYQTQDEAEAAARDWANQQAAE